MLLTIRRIKQKYFSNAEFRKYLLYALGEMALVVIGILIALQIDNWNSNRLQQQTLNNYLRTIARNIESDLAAMNEIRAERLDDYERSIRWLGFTTRIDTYSVAETTFAGELIGRASTLHHFNANTSGYEALKNSGTLDQMQGTDIERVLYDYYDTVARISAMEQDHNELSRLLSLQAWAGWPEEFEAWELSTAFALTSDWFEYRQPLFRQVLQDAATERLVDNPRSVGPLLREYDTLNRLGRVFQRMVETGSTELDETSIEILDGIYDPSSGIGQPNLVVDGQVAWHSHHLINSDANNPQVSYSASTADPQSPYDISSFQRIGDSLHLGFHGGAEWAGIWLVAGTDLNARRIPDYSMYDTLVLELKGDLGGEKIFVNLEDRDDPMDGTSTRYEITLSDEWQTHEIDLTEFETADLTILSVPLGFAFFDKAVGFSVRTAKFTKAD